MGKKILNSYLEDLISKKTSEAFQISTNNKQYILFKLSTYELNTKAICKTGVFKDALLFSAPQGIYEK